ncbi:hypothetical protein D3C78_1623230 [compost metagenome]
MLLFLTVLSKIQRRDDPTNHEGFIKNKVNVAAENMIAPEINMAAKDSNSLFAISCERTEVKKHKIINGVTFAHENSISIVFIPSLFDM